MKRFLLTLFLCLMASCTALLMIHADFNSRLNTGDMQKQIYSYQKISEAEGELELFGSVYHINLHIAADITEKALQALETNASALPVYLQHYLRITGQSAGNLTQQLITSLRTINQP